MQGGIYRKNNGNGFFVSEEHIMNKVLAAVENGPTISGYSRKNKYMGLCGKSLVIGVEQ